MANPAPKTPSGNQADNAAILTAVRELGDHSERRFETLDERLRKVESDVSEIKGQRRSMPTIWTLAALIFAIFGAAFVLIRFASGHG